MTNLKALETWDGADDLRPAPPVSVHRVVAVAATAAALGCAAPGPSRAQTAAYQPRTRELTVTTVPLLVREAGTVYPFLEDAFAPGGVLDGKEVYGFSPNTLVVVEGDTVELNLINPEDDEHAFLLPDCTAEDIGSFVPPDCGVDLPPQQAVHASYVARRAGIYPFFCKVTKHLPMMWGQLVVLAPGAVRGDRE
jgi:hypothetical protein